MDQQHQQQLLRNMKSFSEFYDKLGRGESSKRQHSTVVQWAGEMYGNCFQEQRYMPYHSRNTGGTGVGPGSGSAGNASHQSTLCPSQQQQQHQQQQQQLQVTSANASSYCQLPTDKSLNSSYNRSSYSDSGRNSTLCSSNTHNSDYNNYSMDCVGGAGNRSGTAGSSASVSPMPTPSIQPPQGPGTGASQGQHTVIISNLDKSMGEHSMHQFLLCQLKQITPYISLTIQRYPWLARVKVSSEQCAMQVVVNLHQKQMGQKRLQVSYVKASSRLRGQVVGLLNDVPYYSRLSIQQFRKLFQTRFNFSPSWLDLHGMQDVCTITRAENEVIYIALQPDLIDTLNNSKLVGTFQHSLPYCMFHFPQEKEIEPLPSVSMSIVDLQSLVYLLLESHESDTPVASVLSCFEHVLRINILPNKNGVPLEHLLCCIKGVQITNNRFGIKVLSRIEHEPNSTQDSVDTWAANLPPLLQTISREVVEMITVSPKSTMQFSRFTSAYYTHFGRNFRLVDYGYTRLIDLFEALLPVVQVMGDGENRNITLTHRVQMQRFTNELLTILRSRTEKSILLSQLPMVFNSVHRRRFNVTDYGVCDIFDIVNGLANSNSITATVCNGNDVLFSIAKNKQTAIELEKMCTFAAEAVNLFRASPQFSIRFTKFAPSYHRRYGYQCHQSDYGFLRLADLLAAISGIVEMERSNAEDCEIYLNHQVARRIFAEEVQEIIKYYTGHPGSVVGLNKILSIHQSKCGYLLQPSCLGCINMYDAMNALPYTEVLESGGSGYMLRSHLEDPVFRARTYEACAILIESEKDRLSVAELCRGYTARFKTVLTANDVFSMKHALLMEMDRRLQTVTLTPLMKFVVRIAQVVKHRGSLKVHDLKLALSVSVGTCFELGFPSVSSVLNYFADVFVESNSSHIHDRSVITLNRECILSQVRFTGEDRSSLGGTSLGTSDLAPIAEYPPVDSRYRPPTDNKSTVLGLPSANPCFAQPQRQQHPSELQRPNNASLLPLQPLQPSRLFNQQHQRSPMNPYCASNINRNPYASVPNGFGGVGREVSSNSSGAFTSLPGATPSMGQYAPMPEQKQGKENNFYSRVNTAPEQLGNAFQTQCSLRAFGSVEAPTMQPHSQRPRADSGALAQNCSPLLQSWKRSPAAEQTALLNLGASDLIRNLKLQYGEPPKPDTAPGLNVPFWSDPIWNDTGSCTGP